jgi:hypothetical protein
MSFVCIFDISFFNYFGISITKYATASNRVTVDLFRILFVWIFSVLLGLEKFKPILLPGFITLSLGFIIYNEMLIIPFFGLDQIPTKNKKDMTIEVSRQKKDDSLLAVLNKSN